MRILIYISFLAFFPACLYAQVGKDSIYMLDYQKKIYTKNFLQHNLSSPTNFGDVSLNYSQRTGNRKLAQQAHTNQTIDFYALGANQLGDFRISGDFLFSKVLEDSLSYGQRNDIDEWSTFNYYASKAGKYERQNYKANLTLSYKLNRFIQPFFNVNYLHHWTTGSVDPRFESKKFEMKYNPGIIVHLKETNLGLKAILGNGRENAGVGYKNKNFGQSLLFPDRIHYLNLGYGLISIKDTLNTRKYSKLFGAEVSLHTKLGRNILDINSSMERKNENSTNDLKSTNVYRKRGTYEQDTYTLNASLQMLRNHSHHLFTWDTKYISGQDGLINFSPSLDKVNYTVDYLESKAGYLFSNLKQAKWNYDLGMDLDYYNIERNDYATFLKVSNTFVHVSPKFNLRYKGHDRDYVQVGFTPRLILDIDHEIAYSPNSLNNFIQGVVFWDYDYYSTNAMNLNWNVKWITSKVSTQYLFGVKADFTLEKNFGANKDNRLSAFPVEAQRNSFSIAVFLNL